MDQERVTCTTSFAMYPINRRYWGQIRFICYHRRVFLAITSVFIWSQNEIYTRLLVSEACLLIKRRVIDHRWCIINNFTTSGVHGVASVPKDTEDSLTDGVAKAGTNGMGYMLVAYLRVNNINVVRFCVFRLREIDLIIVIELEEAHCKYSNRLSQR